MTALCLTRIEMVHATDEVMFGHSLLNGNMAYAPSHVDPLFIKEEPDESFPTNPFPHTYEEFEAFLSEDGLLPLSADHLSNYYSRITERETFYPSNELESSANEINLSPLGDYNLLPFNDDDLLYGDRSLFGLSNNYLIDEDKDLLLSAVNSTSNSGASETDFTVKSETSINTEVPEISKSCEAENIRPVQTYTPDYDHSYSTQRPSVPSDSSDSETSGEEVDIETIPEDEVAPLYTTIKLQRPGKRPLDNVQPAKRRRVVLEQRETASIRARFSAQTRRQNRKVFSRTKRGRRPARFIETSPCSSRGSSDTEEPVKRKMHNCMERMRREQLRQALQSLREQIPDLKHDHKAAKVKILDKSTKHIHETVEAFLRRDIERKALIKKNKCLMRQFEKLKKLCFSTSTTFQKVWC